MLRHQARLASMGELLANIAHQQRQPLNALSAIIIYIKACLDNAAAKNGLAQKLNDATELIAFMSETIDDFRDFYAPKSKKEHFMLCEAMAKTRLIIGKTLSLKGIIIKENIDKNISLYGYKNEFANLILNLIQNSIDAYENVLDDGQKEIVIRAWQNSKKTLIIVEDRAGGIPAWAIKSIFVPYFSTKAKGSGLGLYITKMLLEEIGASINFKNKNGGAWFIIRVRGQE